MGSGPQMRSVPASPPPPLPAAAMGQREAAAPGGEAGARPPPAETCRAGCGVGCRPRTAPAPRPPPRAPPRGGEEPAAPAPGSPAQPRPGRGRPRSCGGSERGGPCWGRLRGWGSFCTGIKRVFPRPGSPSPFFFEGDVRQGLILHRWAPSDRGAPKGGWRIPVPPPCDLRPPGAAVGRTERDGAGGDEEGGTGSRGEETARRQRQIRGRRSGNGDRPGRESGNGVLVRGGRSRSVRGSRFVQSCRAPRQEMLGKVPPPPPPSGHPPRSVQCPRIGAAAIRVPPHTAGPHLSHGCQHRGGP